MVLETSVPRVMFRMMRPGGDLLFILSLALIVRLAFVLFYPQVKVVADAAAYDQEAYELAFGKGLVQGDGGTAQISKGPVYLVVLAAIYLLFGHNHTAVRVVQAIVSFLAVLLIYVIATEVFDRRVALLASLLAALYPPFISYPGWLLTETLGVFLLLGFVYSLIKALSRPGFAYWVMAGIMGGITVLLREEMMVIVALVAVAAWWWQAGRRRVGIFLLAVALTVFPWTVRNYLLFHEFVLVSANGGETLWISSYEKEWLEWHSDDPHYQSLVAGLSPIERDKRLRNEGIKNIVTQPLTYLKLCIKRIPRFWIGGHSNTFVHLEDALVSYLARRDYLKVAVKLTMLVCNMGIIILGFGGIYLAWSLRAAETRRVFLLALPVFVKAVIHFFLFATLRYQVPVMPFLIIFTAFALCALGRTIPARSLQGT